MEEGKLAEALATYEAVYRTFEEAGARQQMAAVLAQISIVYRNQGEYDKAIEKSDAALTILRGINDEEGQAISLHQLSMLYMLKEDYNAGLARSQEAEALNRKLGREVGVATNLHEQGLIYNRLARAAADDAEAARQRQAAFDRFTESLTISRRIGDEAGAGKSLGELGKLHRDAGRIRRRSLRSTKTWKSTSVWAIPHRLELSSSSWAASTNARASSRPRWRSISRRWSCTSSTRRQKWSVAVETLHCCGGRWGGEGGRGYDNESTGFTESFRRGERDSVHPVDSLSYRCGKVMTTNRWDLPNPSASFRGERASAYPDGFTPGPASPKTAPVQRSGFPGTPSDRAGAGLR